uniref:Cyclic nucleotide-binding domain-containing protein n=1 Tax=Tetraselmis chuii TaxID=63592 RepID=A0A7S1SIN5_9CHLO|mmetsp:Transcript_13142/g.23427  ORF Transcript_13142/g.23427 Transcript_13142/m.23427 type:complete len:725 (+) Transcript_13142:308-2482(+)
MSGEDQTVGLLASPPSPVIPADSGGVEAGDIPGVPNNTRTDNPLPGLSARNNSNSTQGTEPHTSADDVLSNKLSPTSDLASLRLGPLPGLPAGGLSAVASSAGRQPAPFKSSSDVAHLVQREKVLGRVDSASYVKRASEGTIDVSSPAGSRMAVHFPHASFSHHTGSAVRRLGHNFGAKFQELAASPDSRAKEHMNRPIQDMEPSRRGSTEDEPGKGCNVPVIHPLSKFRNYWDFIVILLVIYTSLVLPVRTAFLWAEEEAVTDTGEIDSSMDGWTVMDLVIDFTFLFDVILNFNTGFIREPDFVAILSRKRIAMQYCKGWFVFDVVSSVPLDLMIMQQSSTVMKLPRVLRLIRIFRLVKVLRLSRAVRYAQRLQIFARMSTFGMRITKLISLGVIFLHWNACAQFLVAVATDFPEGCWVERMGIIDHSIFTQYTWAMFMASSQMFCIGYGATMPVLIQEAWVDMISFIMGASLFAVFVGIITSVLISIDSISSGFYQKMEIVNQYMAHRKLPLDLRQRIRDSMDYKWRTRRALDEGSILSGMPGGLRSEVAVYTCKPLIMRVPFFQEVSEGFIESLVLYLQPEVFLNGEIIIKEGVIAREMFFLNLGSVRISKNGFDIVTLHEGNYFGEIGLLLNAPRSATVAATSDCEVYVLHKTSLLEVLHDFPEVKTKLEAVAEERLEDALRKSKFPSKFPAVDEDEDGEIDTWRPPVGSSIGRQKESEG